jgi:hypothetical protein
MIPLKDDIPSFRPPIVTVALISVNCLVFFYLLSFGEGFQNALFKWGAIPFEITHGKELTPQAAFPIPLSLFSSMFMHGGFLHLAGNMLYLWIFGDNVEDRLGHFKFFVFYILSGLAASLLYILTSPQSQVPMIGASGAIAGVLGAYKLSQCQNLNFGLVWILHPYCQDTGTVCLRLLVYTSASLRSAIDRLDHGRSRLLCPRGWILGGHCAFQTFHRFFKEKIFS